MKVLVVDGGTVCGEADIIRTRGEVVTVRFDNGIELEFDTNQIDLILMKDEDQ